MILVAQKPSIQLEGYTINTEISDIVYNDILQSNSKYIHVDRDTKMITLKKAFFKRNKQVQNVTRFFVEINEEGTNINKLETKHDLLNNSSFNDELIEPNFKNKTIAIVLESPHIDEYESTNEKLIPKGPAQGIIGRKIERNIDQLALTLSKLDLLELNHRYRIIIINAVNFQTSLHFIHEKPMSNHYRDLRDKIWTKMWCEMPQVKEDFLTQIDQLKKGSIIINSCPKSLKPFINQELIQLSKRFVLLESNHPSSTEIWTNSLFKLN